MEEVLHCLLLFMLSRVALIFSKTAIATALVRVTDGNVPVYRVADGKSRSFIQPLELQITGSFKPRIQWYPSGYQTQSVRNYHISFWILGVSRHLFLVFMIYFLLQNKIPHQLFSCRASRSQKYFGWGRRNWELADSHFLDRQVSWDR